MLDDHVHTPKFEKVRFLLVEKQWECSADDGLLALQQMIAGQLIAPLRRSFLNF